MTIQNASWVLLGLTVVLGCSTPSSGVFGDGAPVHGLATEKVYSGVVPNPSDITVEGMVASKSLRLESPPCDEPVCLRAAYGVDTAEKDSVLVRFELSKTERLSKNERRPLIVALIGDSSDSMEGEKLGAVRSAVIDFWSYLEERDQRELEFLPGSNSDVTDFEEPIDSDLINDIVGSVYADGKADLGRALTSKIVEVNNVEGEPDALKLVVVFVDAVTQVRALEDTNFSTALTQAADTNVSLLFFGLGPTPNQNFAHMVQRTPSASFNHLSSYERIVSVFDAGIEPWLTPVASNVTVRVVPTSEFQLGAAYGLGRITKDKDAFELKLTTVFAAGGEGSVLLELRPTNDWPRGNPKLAELTFSFDGPNGEVMPTQTLSLNYEGKTPLTENVQFFSEDVMRKVFAFAVAAEGESEACRLYWDNQRSAAVALLKKVESQLYDTATEFHDDSALVAEAEFVKRLRENIRRGDYLDAETADDKAEDAVGCNLSVPGRYRNGLPIFSLLVAASVFRRTRRARKGNLLRQVCGLASVFLPFTVGCSVGRVGTAAYKCECTAVCSKDGQPRSWVDQCNLEPENLSREDIVINAEDECASSLEVEGCRYPTCSCLCKEIDLDDC